MHLRVSEIDVPEDAPFTNDRLSREESVESVKNLVASYSESIVIALNSPWGSGKTTFLKMLRARLHSEKFQTLYFNAWECDYIEDPLICLIGDIKEQIESLTGADKSKARKALEVATKAGSRILKAAMPIAVKVLTANVLDLNSATEDAIADGAESFTKEQIDAYLESKSSVKTFKESLLTVTDRLYGDDKGKPLVFIVDELDRCRPVHAVKLLEIIKHLFAIERMVFVVAIDMEQMGHSVGTMYGHGIDSVGYLRKFFDLELMLPRPAIEEFVGAQFGRFGLEDFFSKRESDGINRFERQHVSEIFTSMFRSMDFSLRDQERAFALLALSIRTTRANNRIRALIVCALIVVKLKNPALYKQVRANRARVEEIISFLSSGVEGAAFMRENYGFALEAELAHACLPAVALNERYQSEGQLARFDNPNDESRTKAEIFLEVSRELRFEGRALTLSEISSRIDLFA